MKPEVYGILRMPRVGRGVVGRAAWTNTSSRHIASRYGLFFDSAIPDARSAIEHVQIVLLVGTVQLDCAPFNVISQHGVDEMSSPQGCATRGNATFFAF